MKITRIKLSDFRNHKQTDTAFERLTILRGANHSGKSTIAQAIEFALTGRCDSTDAKGTGATSLIRNGGEKALIQLALNANKAVQLRCSLTEKSGRTVAVRDPDDPTYSGEAVLHWLAIKKPVLSCLLNSRYFIGLKPAEQKTLLSSIVLPASYEWDEAISGKLSQAGVRVNCALPPFEFIEAAYADSYARRRDINRDLKNLHIPEPLPAPEGVTSLDAANRELLSLRAEGEKIASLTRKRDAERSDRAAAIAKVQGRIEGLEAKGSAEEEKQAQFEKEILNAKTIKALQATAAKQKKADEYERELHTIRQGLAAVRAIIGIFNDLDGEKCCPMCQREVTDEFLTSAMAPNLEHQNKLLERERDTLKLLGELGNPADAQQKLDRNTEVVANHKRARAVLAETTATLRSLRNEMEEMQEQQRPPQTSANDQNEARLAELGTEIATRESQLGSIAAYEQRKAEIEQAREQHRKLAIVSTLLDELVDYFGPNGIKAELLGKSIGEFTSSMNDVLIGWGYSCDLQIEPYGFHVTKLEDKGDTFSLPLELLSNSERLRFAVAFQVALAQVSGVRLVVVDEVDMLDSKGRDAFYEMLLSADIDQAIAIGTDERTEVPDIPDTAFYAINDGCAVRLGATDAVAA